MDSVFDIVTFRPAEHLTGLQMAVGYLTWINILKVFSLLVGGVCFAYLFGRLVQLFSGMFMRIPLVIWDCVGYAVVAILLVGAHFFDPALESWFVVPGCILFAGMLMITGLIHKLDENPTKFSAALAVVWGAVAVYYGDPVVGFGAVAALMAFFGFSVFVTPIAYCIGFDDEAAMYRAGGAGLMLCVILVLKHWLAPGDAHLAVFEQGMLWLGPFVFALAILIVSTRWYEGSTNYLMAQVVAVVSFAAMIAVGSMLGIDTMRNVGTAFLALYLVTKPFELPFQSVLGYAITGLIVAILVGAFVFWTQAHPDEVARWFGASLS